MEKERDRERGQGEMHELEVTATFATQLESIAIAKNSMVLTLPDTEQERKEKQDTLLQSYLLRKAGFADMEEATTAFLNEQ